MAKVNTLIRKGYLFAGVIMAANMFVVNEMRASTPIINGQTWETSQNLQDPLNKSTNMLNISNNEIGMMGEIKIEEENTGAPEVQPKQKIFRHFIIQFIILGETH